MPAARPMLQSTPVRGSVAHAASMATAVRQQQHWLGAARARPLQLRRRKRQPPLHSPLPTRSTGMITSVQVGGKYVDAGATAIKIPSTAALPSVILTSSIVVRGLASVSTAVPTPPTQPLVISYDVADTAVPPNRALTVRRRLQVLCPTAEKICTSDAGTLYCSFGGICTGGSTGGSAAATYTFWPSDSIVPQLSLNGPLSITLAANVPYAPCLGAMTSGCELGATASLNTTGDFDSKVIACENEVRECRGKGRGIGGSCPAVLLLSGQSVPSSQVA